MPEGDYKNKNKLKETSMVSCTQIDEFEFYSLAKNNVYDEFCNFKFNKANIITLVYSTC